VYGLFKVDFVCGHCDLDCVEVSLTSETSSEVCAWVNS
jgi:hypothetical protein